jgi:hypothetical protein
MNGYTKLFGSIVASTIWREDDKTRIVWVTMLAMANKHGDVESSIPGLSDLARVSITDVEKALKTLSEPDSYSRTKDYEGRRISEIEGGWHILNHAKYREKMSKDERRNYLARKQAERRARLKAESERVNNESTNVAVGQQPSTDVNVQRDIAEADTEAKEGNTPRPFPSGFPKTIKEARGQCEAVCPEAHPDFIEDVWEQSFQRNGRDAAETQIGSFPTYVRRRWRKEQMKWESERKKESGEPQQRQRPTMQL